MSVPVAHNQQLEADLLFDQNVFRTISYSATGFLVGVAVSALFKYKRPVIFFSGGVGAGQGVFDFQRDLQSYRNLGYQQNQKN